MNMGSYLWKKMLKSLAKREYEVSAAERADVRHLYDRAEFGDRNALTCLQNAWFPAVCQPLACLDWQPLIKRSNLDKSTLILR